MGLSRPVMGLLYLLHRLLVTKKKGSTFPRANYCQGQLRTSQSVSVLWAHYQKSSKLQATRGEIYATIYLGNIIQFICILGQCFSTRVPRNPNVAHNMVRSSARNSVINEHTLWIPRQVPNIPRNIAGIYVSQLVILE
jgi:hypothetical protein